MLYQVVLTFESVDEILWCDHSNESYWAVLSRSTVYYAVRGGSNFWICLKSTYNNHYSQMALFPIFAQWNLEFVLNVAFPRYCKLNCEHSFLPVDLTADRMPPANKRPDRSEVTSFDQSKLNHVPTTEKVILPSKEGKTSLHQNLNSHLLSFYNFCSYGREKLSSFHLVWSCS